MGNAIEFMGSVSKIVLHCSDSPNDRDIGRAEIDEWHKERGWKEVGYHWIVRIDGRLEKGRDESRPGAHVQGHNANTIGVVLVGRDSFPAYQMVPALVLVASLVVRHNLKATDVVGHRELAPLSGKTCPNTDMNHFREHLKTYLTKEYHE